MSSATLRPLRSHTRSRRASLSSAPRRSPPAMNCGRQSLCMNEFYTFRTDRHCTSPDDLAARPCPRSSQIAARHGPRLSKINTHDDVISGCFVMKPVSRASSPNAARRWPPAMTCRAVVQIRWRH